MFLIIFIDLFFLDISFNNYFMEIIGIDVKEKMGDSVLLFIYK